MLVTESSESLTAPTLFIQSARERYAYRRFGTATAVPLLLLQHFTGTLDYRDGTLTDALAEHSDVILFDNAGVGLSSGIAPPTMAMMAEQVIAFLDALQIQRVDILGFLVRWVHGASHRSPTRATLL